MTRCRYETLERLEAEYVQLERDYQRTAEKCVRYREALEAVLTWDAFRGENETTRAMRNLVGGALRDA